MTDPVLRCLVVESEPAEARRLRLESVGHTSGETFARVLDAIAPCRLDEVRPTDGAASLPDGGGLDGYDAVFLTGSPLHLYHDTPETRRQVDLMRAVFASGTPAFGSCAGLQVACVAAGGTVRPNLRGREAAFARRIVRTEQGRDHPLLGGRPEAFDAPCIHADEVDTLPDGATCLATNRVTDVQAAEIRHGRGIFWGVQYHPELCLGEVAAALRRQGDALVEEGFAADRGELEGQATMIDELGRSPDRRDLAWRLGLDDQVTDARERVRELRNFIERLVRPTASARGRA